MVKAHRVGLSSTEPRRKHDTFAAIAAIADVALMLATDLANLTPTSSQVTIGWPNQAG